MASEKEIKINFNEIVENYNKILTSTSRGFDTQYEFLEAWVPSENKVSCILDLFAVAKEYSIKKLILELDRVTVDLLNNNEEFNTKLTKLGSFEIKDLNLKINLS